MVDLYTALRDDDRSTAISLAAAPNPFIDTFSELILDLVRITWSLPREVIDSREATRLRDEIERPHTRRFLEGAAPGLLAEFEGLAV